ncbi:hypothetical protein EVAR_32592_1 [Eumeta japonica]|uniref:Uncharacterized protein n=1 Tax=Eumeta variegata TaxID=151549 RepID=A0A4C1WJK9_EUMVA|nr:hypothetical protein EVAR_32592_1 [Eumeta japonica]
MSNIWMRRRRRRLESVRHSIPEAALVRIFLLRHICLHCLLPSTWPNAPHGEADDDRALRPPARCLHQRVLSSVVRRRTATPTFLFSWEKGSLMIQQLRLSDTTSPRRGTNEKATARRAEIRETSLPKRLNSKVGRNAIFFLEKKRIGGKPRGRMIIAAHGHSQSQRVTGQEASNAIECALEKYDNGGKLGNKGERGPLELSLTKPNLTAQAVTSRFDFYESVISHRHSQPLSVLQPS